jgi:hypothetical protein
MIKKFCMNPPYAVERGETYFRLHLLQIDCLSARSSADVMMDPQAPRQHSLSLGECFFNNLCQFS